MAWSKTKFAVDIDSLCIFGSSLCLRGYFGLRGYFALREAVEKLLKDKFQIDFLMLIAAAGAAFLGNGPKGRSFYFFLRLAMR
jgi:Cd2+/Zn2+-exporting ATPase